MLRISSATSPSISFLGADCPAFCCTPLPGHTRKNGLPCRFNTHMVITDDQLHAMQPVPDQSFQKCSPVDFRHLVLAGNIGVNIGVATPMAFFPFSGWKDNFYGDLHDQSMDAVDFFTQKKVVIERWKENGHDDSRIKRK